MTQPISPELRYLLDRQEIHDVINRYARAVDRHDVEMMESCYEEDAIDEHGPFRGKRDAFIEWVNAFHSEHTTTHMHNITTHNCEIDGDSAHAESYSLYVLRRRGSDTVIIGGGRYVDRLTRVDGKWKISLRKVYIDWRAEAPAIDFDSSYVYPRGSWSRADASYERPLVPTAE